MVKPIPDWIENGVRFFAPLHPKFNKNPENKKTITKMEIIKDMLICILDGNNITNREILHDTLTSSLHLPDWYGRNLDALYDCLLDIQEETEIRLFHKEALEDYLGRYAKTLKKAVCKACQENPRIHYYESL